MSRGDQSCLLSSGRLDEDALLISHCASNQTQTGLDILAHVPTKHLISRHQCVALLEGIISTAFRLSSKFLRTLHHLEFTTSLSLTLANFRLTT